MMNVFKTIIDGLWINFFSRTVNIDGMKFKVYVPFAFACLVAIVIKFLGGGKSE